MIHSSTTSLSHDLTSMTPYERILTNSFFLLLLTYICLPTVANDELDIQSTVTRGPDVVLIESEKRSIFEYRQNGQLRMIKIVPRIGPAYFLVPSDPTRGDGDLERAETLLPSWTIIEF